MKKSLTIFSLLSLALPSLALAATYELGKLPYTDSPPDHESALAVSTLSDEGVLKGNPDGTFGWNDLLNRAAFVTIVMRFSNTPLPEVTKNCFPDVEPSAWYAEAVCAAKELGLISGNAVDGVPKDQWLFKPERAVQYEEAAKILAEKFHHNVLATKRDEEWYESYLRYIHIHHIGLEELHDDRSFPSDEELKQMAGTKLTRAQMSKLAARFFAAYGDELDTYLYAVNNGEIAADEKKQYDKINPATMPGNFETETMQIGERTYTYFPVGWDARPLSTNDEWNACFRSYAYDYSEWSNINYYCTEHDVPQMVVSSAGVEVMHPDLHMTFTLESGNKMLLRDSNYVPRVEPTDDGYEGQYKEILRMSQPAVINGRYLISIPLGDDGLPTSSYDLWNKCIRAYYHSDNSFLENECPKTMVKWDKDTPDDNYAWMHPDLFFSFQVDKKDLGNLVKRYIVTDDNPYTKQLFTLYPYASNPIAMPLTEETVKP